MNFKLLLILVLSSLAVLFIAQNVALVDVGFLFWHVSISSALLVFFSLALGFVLGWFLHDYLKYRQARDKSIFLN